MNDIFVVKKGSKIPTGSVILEGIASVDKSMITGKSMPADKGPGYSAIGKRKEVIKCRVFIVMFDGIYIDNIKR